MHAYNTSSSFGVDMRGPHRVTGDRAARNHSSKGLFGLQSGHIVTKSFTPATPLPQSFAILLHLTLCACSASAALHPKQSIWRLTKLPPDDCRIIASPLTSDNHATYLKVFGRSCTDGHPQNQHTLYWVVDVPTSAEQKATDGSANRGCAIVPGRQHHTAAASCNVKQQAVGCGTAAR